MNELRTDIDESAVLTEHFILKRNQALKELALFKDKIRSEEDPSLANRRQNLENEYQQTLVQLKELTRRYQDLDQNRQSNQEEMNQMNDLYKQLEGELHDLILGNIRLECNLRTIEEQTLLKKAVYETEKAELVNEKVQQEQLYTNELDKAIDDIKRDFQALLKTNKVTLENAYTERIEQVKTQISTYQSAKEQQAPLAMRASIESSHSELKEIEKTRDAIESDYRPLLDLYMAKQREKNGIDDERVRLDTEYNRLITEINQISESIEVGKQYWFSVRFELETYRRLLDLQSSNSTLVSNHHVITNGKAEHVIVDVPRSTNTQKLTSQRAISKTGKTNEKAVTARASEEGSILTCSLVSGNFDIDQVQAGFISINNASTNCVDQPLKGWTIVRTVNDEQETSYQFPDSYTLKARTRVRVYSNKVENSGSSTVANSRMIATSVPAWASSGQGDNVKITLLDDKGINRAQYSEAWQ